jgi:hypothetical protein
MKTLCITRCSNLLLLLLLLTTHLCAQDYLFLKGEQKGIQVKVVEIGLDEIKYRPFGDTAGPVLSFARYQVDRIVLNDGKMYEFKGETQMGAAIDYSNQAKNAIKVNPFSPINGHLAFSFEHSLAPGKSYELGLSFIGLGMTYPDLYDVPPKPVGTTMRLGFKFINQPDFYVKGMRYFHLLNGGYIKPEITVSMYEITRSTVEQSYFSTKPVSTERRSVVATALLINLGKQWVVSDAVVFDTYIGFGAGYCNYSDEDYTPEVFHYGFTVLPVVPLAFTAGFRLGILLKDNKLKK